MGKRNSPICEKLVGEGDMRMAKGGGYGKGILSRELNRKRRLTLGNRRHNVRKNRNIYFERAAQEAKELLKIHENIEVVTSRHSDG